jgi:DNA segregation ATPase FtsK/SpoIIIE, S-DNA-T family
MPFNRPPRIPLANPKDLVEIPPPPPLLQEPGSMNWMSILLPLGATLLMVVLMLAMAGGGGGSGLSYLVFLPMMLAGFAVTYFSFRSQKLVFQKKLAANKAEYAKQIQKTENHLYSLRDLEQTVLRDANPGLAECLQFAKTQDPRLGERRPTDTDFLSLRMGVGMLRSAIEIHPATARGRAGVER